MTHARLGGDISDARGWSLGIRTTCSAGALRSRGGGAQVEQLVDDETAAAESRDKFRPRWYRHVIGGSTAVNNGDQVSDLLLVNTWPPRSLKALRSADNSVHLQELLITPA